MKRFEPRPPHGTGIEEQTARWLAEGVIRDVRDYAIFLLDPEGRVASWNAGAQRIKGYTADEIIGSHFSRFYPPEAIAGGLPDRELRVARSDGRFEDEGYRLRKDGSRFWASVIITGLRDENGEFRGYLKITRDLTDRRIHEEALQQSEERFRLLVDGARDYAIALIDSEGRVISWNAGAERITGYRRTEALGMRFEDLMPVEPDRLQPLAAARASGRHEEEAWWLRKDGTRFCASTVITALQREDGTLRGYATVARDLTDRKRVEALEAETRQITAFLAMLGHELRNPLAPVQNALEVMRESKVGSEGMRWSQEVIGRQVGHLTRLVDDLLDVSRITTGKIVLRREAVELRDVVTHAVDATRPQFEARAQRLELSTEAPVWVRGDPTRLSQVVFNLLNNAAKYTPEQGHVHISLRNEGEHVVIRVRDNGIGMTPDLVARVFDLFTQGERAIARSEGGLGIGLTLVRHLVSLHDGEVTAASAGIGRGSEFIVRLPRLATEGSAAPAPSRGERPATSGGRVLVVDDNHDSADTIARLIEIWGHPARTAYDGAAAIAAALEWKPDFVLLDLGLPSMDGFDVARNLRQAPGLERVRIVAMSGYGQPADRQRTREAGFDHHLVKPVDLAALRQLLSEGGPGRDS